MLCQKCGKRPATVHFTNMINGVKAEYYLCDHCAGQSDLGQMEIQDLISGFFGMQTKQGMETLTCDFCNTTLAQVKKKGKAGCPQCYHTFASYLDPIVRKVQGGEQHVGKRPAMQTEQPLPKQPPQEDLELERLQEQMKQAIATENYEEAARLRDMIANRGKKGASS